MKKKTNTPPYDVKMNRAIKMAQTQFAEAEAQADAKCNEACQQADKVCADKTNEASFIRCLLFGSTDYHNDFAKDDRKHAHRIAKRERRKAIDAAAKIRDTAIEKASKEAAERSMKNGGKVK